MSDTQLSNVQRWIEWFEGGHTDQWLADELDDDVVFYSPVVHRPQNGKMLAMAYLLAAGKTLSNENFRYVQVFDCDQRAVLEFETEMDGIYVNGIDMIEWNDQGKIISFKVMVRPLKAMQVVHAQMGKMLEAMQAAQQQ